MIYTCAKCKRTWQHKVASCLHCNSDVVARQEKGLKVMHCVKVGIASVQHPDVPYYALQLADDEGNIFFRKSVKEYKPGESYDGAC